VCVFEPLLCWCACRGPRYLLFRYGRGTTVINLLVRKNFSIIDTGGDQGEGINERGVRA